MGPFSWEFSGDDGDNFWNWMGAEHDNDVQMDLTLTAAKPAVTINDPQGDVTITASSDNQMHLRAHEMVHRDSDSEAQKVFADLKPKLDASGGGAVVTVPQKQGARVDLTLELPAASFATITAGHGDVTADGLNGDIPPALGEEGRPNRMAIPGVLIAAARHGIAANERSTGRGQAAARDT